MLDYSICRLCHKASFESKVKMVRYGPRHQAHADCFLKRKGAEGFKLLRDFTLEQFPYFVAKDAGLEKELRDEINYRRNRKPI